MNDTDKLHYIHTGLYSAKAKEIMSSVFGQLSDGWGENNPRNDRYWKFARVKTDETGEVLIEVETCGSTLYCGKYIENGFHVFRDCHFGMMSDDEIKQWMARLVKKTAQMELRDNKGTSGTWKRDNENKCVYLGHYDEQYGPVVTFANAYLVYEHLLGRNYASKYTTGCLDEVLGTPRTETEIAIVKAKIAAKEATEEKIKALRAERDAKIEALNKEYDEKIRSLTIATVDLEVA